MKNNSPTIHLFISTLEGVFFEKDVRSVSLRTVSGGQITFLPEHAPFMSNIEVGKLWINQPNDPDYKLCAIGGGLVYVDSKQIKIITDDIVDCNDIDLQRALKQRDKALSALRTSTHEDNTNIEIQLRKAISKIDIFQNH